LNADAVAVSKQALARGVEAMPLSEYALGRQPVANALIVGFAAVREDAMNSGMEQLAAAIESTKRVELPRSARAAGARLRQ
jgi:DNA-binding transcriptional MocR family regulator